MYAVWRYDLCPYILTGKVVKMLDQDRVRVEGYGKMSFKPIVIIPDEKGEALKSLISDIRRERREMIKEHRKRAKKRVENLVGGIYKDDT